jgi:hypothetical protein
VCIVQRPKVYGGEFENLQSATLYQFIGQINLTTIALYSLFNLIILFDLWVCQLQKIDFTTLVMCQANGMRCYNVI